MGLAESRQQMGGMVMGKVGFCSFFFVVCLAVGGT